MANPERMLGEPSPAPLAALDASEAVRRAESLIDRLRSRAEAVDAQRVVSDESIADINDADLFRISAPLAFGGSQLGIAPLIRTVAAIAAGCGSTGWVYAVLTGHNWMVSLFPAEAQQEVFSDPDALVASVVRLGGKRPTRVDGGYLIEDAVGSFCSGIVHAKWVVLGTAVACESGTVEPQYHLIPKSEVEVIDDWFTAGLRGTRSCSFKVKRSFVPEHRVVSIPDIAAGKAPGILLHDSPVYRAPFPQILPMPLVGVPLGLGRAGVNAYVERYGRRIRDFADEQIAEQSAVFARISDAEAGVSAGTCLVLNDATEIDSFPDGSKIPPLDRARYIRDVAYGANLCRYSIDSLFEASGGSGVYDSVEIQRIWRDINAAAAHNAFVRDKADPAFGRAILGLPPSKFGTIGH